jgi:hypothetical protein
MLSKCQENVSIGLNPSLKLYHDATLIRVEPGLLYQIWCCTLNKSCRPYHGEQTLFNGPKLIQYLALSNRAHEIESSAVLKLRKSANLEWLKFVIPFPCTCLWWFLVCKPCQTWPNFFKQSCRPHIALQHCAIGLVFHHSIYELEEGEERSFNRLETETRNSVSGSLLCSLVSLKPSQINYRPLKQSCSIHVALHKGVIG